MERTTRKPNWENPTLQAAEREHILRALREAGGQIGGAGRRGGPAGAEADDAELKDEEAGDRASRLYEVGTSCGPGRFA